MNQYEGAVFFVDMLGVGALTQNQVPLLEDDFKAWRVKSSPVPSANLFCGQLLTEFRACLVALKAAHKQVKIAQLSDCAYIWSKDVLAVLEAARAFMWGSVSSGLLCRGGLAYGEIVEPDKVNRTLGQFVLGGAVTRAVGLEKAGKGCRVFIDENIRKKCNELLGSPFKHGAVEVLKNPLDGAIINEFCWYRTGGRYSDWLNQQHDAAKQTITLLTLLQYSPRFYWNEATSHGRVQLACSIDSISNATPDFIGNGNYIFNGCDYLSKSWGDGRLRERSFGIQDEVIKTRLADIDRFFLNGKQKSIGLRLLEKSLS